jgi:hypothetical protein
LVLEKPPSRTFSQVVPFSRHTWAPEPFDTPAYNMPLYHAMGMAIAFALPTPKPPELDLNQ